MEPTTINMQPERVTLQPLTSQTDPDKSTQTFLIWSILNNICCFFTCGFTLCCSIPALVFSMNTDSGVKRCDKKMAKRNSLLAFTMNITTSVSILIILIVSIIFWVYIVYFSAKGVQWFCELPLNWSC